MNGTFYAYIVDATDKKVGRVFGWWGLKMCLHDILFFSSDPVLLLKMKTDEENTEKNNNSREMRAHNSKCMEKCWRRPPTTMTDFSVHFLNTENTSGTSERMIEHMRAVIRKDVAPGASPIQTYRLLYCVHIVFFSFVFRSLFFHSIAALVALPFLPFSRATIKRYTLKKSHSCCFFFVLCLNFAFRRFYVRDACTRIFVPILLLLLLWLLLLHTVVSF